MIRHPLFVGSALLSAMLPLCPTSSLLAQTVLNEQSARIGAAPNIESGITGVQRDSFTSPGNWEFLAIMPKRESNGWGHDPSAPLMHRVDGCRVIIDDSDSLTANSYDVSVYREDPQAPAFPDYPNGSTIGPFLTPTTVQGGASTWVLDLVFPSPVMVSDAGDVYLGFEFQAEPASDFLRIGFNTNTDSTPLAFDASNGRIADTGHGIGPVGGYSYSRDVGANATFFGMDAFLAAPFSAQGGFKVAVTTTQASYPSSNPGANPGYTTSLYSSRQPVMTTDILGRARSAPDELVMIYENGNLSANDPVAFFVVPTLPAIGLGIPQSLGVIAGWTGTLCLPATTPPIQVATGMLDMNGKAVVPALGLTNAGLIGADFVFTGIALDLAAGTLHAGGCELVQF